MKIKKTIGVFIASALLLCPAIGLADTTASSSASVQAMLTQILNLQAQIQALQSAQNQVQTAVGNVKQTLTLIRSLKQGMSGDDVSALQAILAADPGVYPQGLITGFFGKLTSDAVKKFQKKHGLETVGAVGPKTLKALNEERDNLGLSEENEHNATSTEHRLCVKVPPGHLIAPGWLKKEGNEKPIVPPCQTLPPGILNHGDNDHHGTTTPPVVDVTAPVISSVGTTNLLGTTTNIVWTTNENATSKVWFGTSTPSTLGSVNGTVMSHVVPLSLLATSTTYFYVVVSTDASGNTATSSLSSFLTTSGL